jgi:hypothetical protein
MPLLVAPPLANASAQAMQLPGIIESQFAEKENLFLKRTLKEP